MNFLTALFARKKKLPAGILPIPVTSQPTVPPPPLPVAPLLPPATLGEEDRTIMEPLPGLEFLNIDTVFMQALANELRRTARTSTNPTGVLMEHLKYTAYRVTDPLHGFSNAQIRFQHRETGKWTNYDPDRVGPHYTSDGQPNLDRWRTSCTDLSKLG